jgi:hypothetical protein
LLDNLHGTHSMTIAMAGDVIGDFHDGFNLRCDRRPDNPTACIKSAFFDPFRIPDHVDDQQKEENQCNSLSTQRFRPPLGEQRTDKGDVVEFDVF